MQTEIKHSMHMSICMDTYMSPKFYQSLENKLTYTCKHLTN